MKKIIGKKRADHAGMKSKWAVVKKNRLLYFMMLPGLLYFLIFKYLSMPTGFLIAFKDYLPWEGIAGSKWVGLYYFKRIFTSSVFPRLMKNTLTLSALGIVFAFPSSIILALMINEVKNRAFKKTVQTISYLPYFISWVVVSGLLYNLLDTNAGVINNILQAFGMDPVRWYTESGKWYGIMTIVKIWKSCGWGTITFLAAITSIDVGLYEAAVVDGANKFRQMWHITLPGIMPTIVVTFILTLGKIFKEDFEAIYAIVGTNDVLYETMDVFETWVYRNTLNGSYSISAAMGLFQNILSLILIIAANKLARRYEQASIW